MPRRLPLLRRSNRNSRHNHASADHPKLTGNTTGYVEYPATYIRPPVYDTAGGLFVAVMHNDNGSERQPAVSASLALRIEPFSRCGVFAFPVITNPASLRALRIAHGGSQKAQRKKNYYPNHEGSRSHSGRYPLYVPLSGLFLSCHREPSRYCP